IRSMDIDDPPDLLVFVGKNNAGKSNIFDLFTFLAQASTDLASALSQRGEGFKDLTRQKQDADPIQIRITFALSEDKRRELVQMGVQIGAAGDRRLADEILASPHLKTVTYELTITQGSIQEGLKTEQLRDAAAPVTFAQVSGDDRNWRAGATVPARLF